MPEQPEQKQETVREACDRLRDAARNIMTIVADLTNDPRRVLCDLADRIEAAAKWECESVRGARDMRDAMEYAFAQKTPKVEQSGNAAALRAALESIIGNLAIHIQCGRLVAPGDHLSFAIAEAEAYIRDARAALSAPARNCDRFRSAVAAMEEWEKYPQSRYKGCRVCPHGDSSMVSPSHLTLAEWLFVPAKGGDAE